MKLVYALIAALIAILLALWGQRAATAVISPGHAQASAAGWVDSRSPQGQW